ncbi:S49 family peptidase [Betaproteobacteria bacterium]|nr:S49 family peptidase [Betaproteobacteria bacterium]
MNNLSDNDEVNNLEKEYRKEKKTDHELVKDNLFATILHDYVRERSANRRWSIMRWVLISSLLFLIFLSLFLSGDQRYPISADVSEHTAVLSLTGTVENDGDINALSVSKTLKRAFENINSVGLILRINSPGGSPVQSALIYDEIRRLKKEYPEKKVIAVVEDIAASGGYFIASAADKIFVNKSSIVGSIGVVFNGFGFVELLKKIGVERRLLVSGENKSMLDPFLPKEEAEEIMIQEMMEDLHGHFIDAVKVGRGSLLSDDPDIFSGRVFTGEDSITLGLSDGFGSVSSVADEIFDQPFLIDYHGEENLLDKLTENFIIRLAVTLKNIFFTQTAEHSIF